MKTKYLSKASIGAALAAASLMSFSGSALALNAGDWLIHGRIINITPNDDSSTIRVDGASVDGTSVEVGDGNSLDVSIGYMLSKNIAVDVLLDISSEHSVSANGLGGLDVPNGTDVVDTRVLPPAVLLQYHFYPTPKIKPYVGVGLNYTLFFDEKLTNAAKTVLGASNLSLDSSFGVAAQAGVDFDLGNNWFVNADVKYITIDTTAEFDTAIGRAAVDVDINPTVLGFGVGVKF